MPKYEGLEDGDLILVDPDTGKTLRVPAQNVQHLDLGFTPEYHVKHATSTIEEDKLGTDIIHRIKKKVDEWVKE